MTERVVVALEPVEVEDDENEVVGLAGAGPDRGLRGASGGCRAGEGVRDGQLAAPREDECVFANVSAVRTKTATTAAAERNHERALWLEVVVDEQRGKSHEAGRRPQESRAAGGRTGRRHRHSGSAARRRARSQRRPLQAFTASSSPMYVLGRALVQVDPVGHRGRADKPGADREPGAFGAPADQREHGDDDRERSGRPRAGRRGQPRPTRCHRSSRCTRSTSNAAPDGRRRERRGDSVQPDAFAFGRDTRARTRRNRATQASG